MFIDWIHWFCSQSTDDLLRLLAPALLLDVTRYTLGVVGLFVTDFVQRVLPLPTRRRGAEEHAFTYCPSVCLVIVGLNEADNIEQTLSSCHGTYPRLQIIVVDDGSNDGMANAARRFAAEHPNVLVLRKKHRGGKSSALNFALPFTQSEIVVCVDGDSQLVENSLWEIVQPFADPDVGAVSATVVARNPFTNVLTWLQAFEYLRCIFVGRQVAAKMGVLGIISGAFGAYRRSAIERLRGWDVGPGEDGDLTLRLRKAGHHIACAPYAQCRTNLPVSGLRLIRQRRRWEWAAVTFGCRKHVDMANPFGRNFRWTNLAVLLERWTYSVVFTYLLWGCAVWTCAHWQEDTGNQIFLYYLMYVLLEVINLGVVIYFSNDRKRDLLIGLCVPLTPLYSVVMRAVTLFSVTEEILTRRSFRDSFVPQHVRDVTWHW